MNVIHKVITSDNLWHLTSNATSFTQHHFLTTERLKNKMLCWLLWDCKWVEQLQYTQSTVVIPYKAVFEIFATLSWSPHGWQETSQPCAWCDNAMHIAQFFLAIISVVWPASTLHGWMMQPLQNKLRLRNTTKYVELTVKLWRLFLLF